MAKGSANSLMLTPSRRESLSKIARRVGSPSAAKVRSRLLSLFSTMESINQAEYVVKLQRVVPGCMARRIVEYAPNLSGLAFLDSCGESTELRRRILRIIHAWRSMPAKVGEVERAAGGFRAGIAGGIRGDPGHSRVPQDAFRDPREPTWVSGLAGHSRSRKSRKAAEERPSRASIELQAGRQLDKYCSELGLQRRDAFIKACDLGSTALQVTLVCDTSRHFDGKAKRRGCLITPALVGRALMLPVEAGVDFYTREMRRVVRQVRLTGFSVKALRRRITPARRANLNFLSPASRRLGQVDRGLPNPRLCSCLHRVRAMSRRSGS